MHESRNPIVSRRGFVKAAGAASLLAQAAPSAKGADERKRIGFIGVGNRGFGAHVRNRLGAGEPRA
jgi:hypothetical protein